MAEAVEEALNNENDLKAAVSGKQPTRAKRKTSLAAGQDGAMIGDIITQDGAMIGDIITQDGAMIGDIITQDGAMIGDIITQDGAMIGDIITQDGAMIGDIITQDGAMVGDIITQVIAAIQPLVIKSVTKAVTAAVATAFKQMKAELQAVETMRGEVKRVKENMARLQIQHFEQDRQEQYNRNDSIRIYGIPEPENDHTREDTNEIIVKLANDIGVTITTADLSVSHRLGRQGRGGRLRTIVATFVPRQSKTDVMRNKKTLQQ